MLTPEPETNECRCNCGKLATIDCATCCEDFCDYHGEEDHILVGHEAGYIETDNLWLNLLSDTTRRLNKEGQSSAVADDKHKSTTT